MHSSRLELWATRKFDVIAIPVLVQRSNPTRKLGLAFREVFQKVNNAPTSDAYSAYSFDAWLVFVDAAARAKGEPGTAGFRQSLRDAIFSTREVVGTHGVYNFKPGSLDGVDERARVIVTLDQGQWKLVP